MEEGKKYDGGKPQMDLVPLYVGVEGDFGEMLRAVYEEDWTTALDICWAWTEMHPAELACLALEYGLEKYGQRGGWESVENGYSRYRSALSRHALAILKGEVFDPESGLSHKCHIAANLYFLASGRLE